MTELKLEIGENLKEVMLKLIECHSDIDHPCIAIQTAFGIDFGKMLKGYGKKIKIETRNIPSGLDRIK